MTRPKYCDVGCDYDGVFRDGFTPPEPEFCIISGRTTDQWDRVVARVGAGRPIYLRPPNFPGEVAIWKATIIRTTGIRKFYEDMADQARDIKVICPECEIVIVEGGQIVRTL